MHSTITIYNNNFNLRGGFARIYKLPPKAYQRRRGSRLHCRFQLVALREGFLKRDLLLVTFLSFLPVADFCCFLARGLRSGVLTVVGN